MRILLAEDDPAHAALLQRGLTEEGHVVDRAASGTKRSGGDVGRSSTSMVLDVMLPELDGFAMVRRMRARGNRRRADADRARCQRRRRPGLNAGADDYLTEAVFAFEVR